jgi:hypothetical protein
MKQFSEKEEAKSKVSYIGIERLSSQKYTIKIQLKSDGIFENLVYLIAGLSDPTESDVVSTTLNLDSGQKSALVLTTDPRWYTINLHANKLISLAVKEEALQYLTTISPSTLIRNVGFHQPTKEMQQCDNPSPPTPIK